MSPTILARVTADELTLYFIGGVLLIGIPPLVGVVASYIMFGTPLKDARSFWKRLLAVSVLCLVITVGLGVTGIYLLEPASSQAVWLTLLMAFIFGLLGAGKLYWSDES